MADTCVECHKRRQPADAASGSPPRKRFTHVAVTHIFRLAAQEPRQFVAALQETTAKEETRLVMLPYTCAVLAMIRQPRRRCGGTD
jgi:hypothetical protein